ncbi:MAG: Rad52/Rad22 family DNA repair protein [Blastocatellia bacterium]
MISSLHTIRAASGPGGPLGEALTAGQHSATLAARRAVQRHKRAQSLAAMGLVSRDGDRFLVSTPAPRGKQTAFEVWRDGSGRVRCSCAEYEVESRLDPGFRCEHILAVKQTLTGLAASPEPAPVTRPASPALVPASVETPPVTVSESNEQPDLAARATRAVKPVTHIAGAEISAETTTEAKPRIIRIREEEVMPYEQKTPGQGETRQEKHSQNGAAMNGTAMNATAGRNQDNVIQMPFTSVLKTLRQPVDPRLVKTREGWTDRNGVTHLVEYVEWHTVADILDHVAPDWSHSVRNITQIGDMVAVTAAITIDGVTREGVGTGTAENETGIKKAEHDALKRAAIKFGIARDLYQRESDAIDKQGTPEPRHEFPRDPLAKSMAELVTPKQLGMIRALGRETSADVEIECQKVLGCGLEELSKLAASRFIDHLKRRQQNMPQPLPQQGSLMSEPMDDLLRAS